MTIAKYARYWKVIDTEGALICMTVYKRGALEVVRRLQQALDDAQQWQDRNGPTEDLDSDIAPKCSLW
jgi:hypothetical protein